MAFEKTQVEDLTTQSQPHPHRTYVHSMHAPLVLVSVAVVCVGVGGEGGLPFGVTVTPAQEPPRVRPVGAIFVPPRSLQEGFPGTVFKNTIAKERLNGRW